MKNTIPQVDDYIEKSAEFAQPILQKIRELFHKAAPQIQEVIKWGTPHFECNGLVGGMAAFKKHVSFGFWRIKEMSDPHNLFSEDPKASMCVVKMSSVSELPPDKIIIEYVKEAVGLNEAGKKAPKPKKSAKKELDVPEYFLAALKKNKKAKATFDGFSPSNKRDYIEWLVEAKQEATRQKRLATAIEWLAEGKPRNWKYMKKW